MHTFAIVGMGMSGTSLFCQLVEKFILEAPAVPVKIIVFEKDAALFATGSAYQVDAPAVWTLNNPARDFVLTPYGIDAAAWIEQNKSRWQDRFTDIDANYVPRALIGLYLKDQYASFRQRAEAQGIIVEEHITEVLDIACGQDESWVIDTKSGQSHQANTLLLCLGHAPSDHFTALKSRPGYIDSPAELDKLKSIPPHEPVHIIGGQATFVDLAVWLAFVQKHSGEIHTITRNRSIVTSKGNNDVCDDKPLAELTTALKETYQPGTLSLAQGTTLFWGAYKKAAREPVDTDNPPATRAALTYQMRKYTHLPVADSAVGNIDELRSFIRTFYHSGCFAEFWDKLRDEDKPEFEKQLSSRIFAYLTGITPLNARLLLELYEKNIIREHCGLRSIEYDDDNRNFRLIFNDGSSEAARYLINASGFGYDISRFHPDFPFLRQLVEKGFLVPGQSGGIKLNDSGQAVNRHGRVQNNLFCIGPVASYGHKYPTPYAFFIAAAAIGKALNAIKLSEGDNLHHRQLPGL